MTQKQIEIKNIADQIFSKLYELNSKGYYTAWFEYVGHTNQIAIRIIKGKWVYGKKNNEICDYLISTSTNRLSDGLTQTPFDLEKCLLQIEKLISYKPEKRKR